MKPQGIHLLDSDAFPAVFGPDERHDLEALVDFAAPPLTGETWAAAAGALGPVELIFSGWGVPRLDAAFLHRVPNLRAVFHAGGTIKDFATDALWARGIRVTCAAAVNAIPVAEFTLAQIVFCLKHGWQRVREVQAERRFRKQDEHMPGGYGSTIGLVSLSRTGRLVAEALRRMEVRVIAYDPVAPADVASTLGVRRCGLEELFAVADVVSCHAPLLPETRHLLRAHHFARMKSGASFINTARGPIVHEPELIEVLGRRPDVFALLDVTDPEPPAADSPLLTLPNVIVTPHIAGSLGPECRRLGRMMVDEARRYLCGQPLHGEVFREQLSRVA